MLVAGLSVGVVLGEIRAEFELNGVIAALHGSTFGIGLLAAGVWGVPLVDRIGRRSALLLSAGVCSALSLIRSTLLLYAPGAVRCLGMHLLLRRGGHSP